MTNLSTRERPLSPHLQIYRWQLTSVTSILTRITGNALILGAILVVWWFVAAATGPQYYAFVDGIVTSWFGDLVMLGSLWGLWYHTLAGVRHLVWDMGWGLDLEVAEKLGWMAVIGSVGLTVLTLVVI